MRAAVRPAVVFCLAVGAGAGLAALTLLPFAEVLFRSYDYHWRSRLGVASLDAKYLLGILLPDFWGRQPFTARHGEEAHMLDRAFYVGALPAMLAAAALVLRPTRVRLAVAILAALTLALVTGWRPLVDLWGQPPIINTIHTNNLIVFFCLAMAVLSGWGRTMSAAARCARGGGPPRSAPCRP